MLADPPHPMGGQRRPRAVTYEHRSGVIVMAAL